jgi:hypothetical protein
MASIHKDIHVGAAPKVAWDALRDYGALHERLVPGFVTDARMDGDDRIVTFVTGAVARERLVTIDDDRCRLVYTVVESGLGARHHQSSVEVVDAADGEGGSRLVWTTDVLPDDLAPIIDALMEQGADAMVHALAG